MAGQVCGSRGVINIRGGVMARIAAVTESKFLPLALSRRMEAGAAILVFACFALLTCRPALALPNNDPADPDGTQPVCAPQFKVSGLPRVVGYALAGQTVTIDATHLKLVNVGSHCGYSGQALGAGDFQWQFALPTGSAGTVTDTQTLRPQIKLDVAGTYTATLTACPTGCTVDFNDLGFPTTLDVGPQVPRTLTFETESFLRPQTLPTLPESAEEHTERTLVTPAERDLKCLGGGGILDPQWVTIEPFYGPPDYAGRFDTSAAIRGVEGVVFKSKVSRKDSPLNHSGQDHNFELKVDPAYESLLLRLGESEGFQQGLDIEWETGDFAERSRPGNGDRVSAIGYWIHDCAHGQYASEIHPPVMLAVHRPRAIHIPDNPGTHIVDWPGGPVGSNVYAPGILTELYINRYAGKMMQCGRTALHQAGNLVPNPFPNGPAEIAAPGACIEDPSPISGYRYSFNIYLPLSPKATLERIGVTGLPDIPLYFEVIKNGPDPMPITLVPVTEGDVTYLHATVDLSGLDPNATAPQTAQIVAAWVYPNTDNWDLSNWRVQVDSVTVHDDSDGTFRGQGEWNMFFHVNNAAPYSVQHEWTRIVNQGITDHTVTVGPGGALIPVGPPLDFTFNGQPWSTGNDVSGDRRLGPDLMLFPGQMIQVHTSGYESDTFSSDSLALVDDLRPQQAGSFSTNNVCSRSNDKDSLVYSDCADYDLNYELINRGSAGGAGLSPQAQTLMDSYDFGNGGGCEGDDVCPGVVVLGELPAPEQEEPWHPDNVVLDPNSPPLSIFDTSLFEPQEQEENALTESSIAHFNEVIRDRLATDPEAVDETLNDLRATIDELLNTVGPEVLLDVRVLCAALPEALCRRHFGDLPPPEPPADASRRFFTGSGKMPDAENTKFTFDVHCNPLVGTNQFKLHWGKKHAHSFRLQLLTSASCEPESEPLHSHRGWALGQLDGSPGAKVHWTLTDEGEPGRNDTVSIDVFDPDNQLVHHAEGKITDANIQAHAL